MAGRGRAASKARENERTKAALAEKQAARTAEWDRQRAEENVGWGDVAMKAASAIPAAGAIAGAGKLGKLVKKVGTKVGAGQKYLGYADQAVDQLFGEGADGATVGGGAKAKAKKKAAELLAKGIAKDAAEAATMAAKSLGIIGVATSLYGAGQLANQKMRQDMTDEEYENFKRTGSTTGSRRGSRRAGVKSPLTKVEVRDMLSFEVERHGSPLMFNTGNKQNRMHELDMKDNEYAKASPLKNEDRKGQVLTAQSKVESDYVGKLAGIAEEVPQRQQQARAAYEAKADQIKAQMRAERSKALQIEDEKERKKAVKAAEQKEKEMLDKAHQGLMAISKATDEAARQSAQAAKDEFKAHVKESSAWSKDHDKQIAKRDKAFSDKGAQKAVAEKMQTDEYKKQAQSQVADVGGNDLEAAQEKMRQQKAVPFDQMPAFKQNYIRMRKAKELGMTGADLRSPYKVKMFLANKQMLNPEDWKRAKQS